MQSLGWWGIKGVVRECSSSGIWVVMTTPLLVKLSDTVLSVSFKYKNFRKLCKLLLKMELNSQIFAIFDTV